MIGWRIKRPRENTRFELYATTIMVNQEEPVLGYKRPRGHDSNVVEPFGPLHSAPVFGNFVYLQLMSNLVAIGLEESAIDFVPDEFQSRPVPPYEAVYAGYVEAPGWGIPLRKGNHDALITSRRSSGFNED